MEHLWLYPDLSAGRLCPCGGNRGQSLGKQAASRAPSSLAARGLLPRRWAWRHGSRDDKPIGVPGGSGPEARADQGAGLPQSLGRADPVPEGARHCCCLRRSDSAIPPGSQRDLGKGGQRISLDALTAAGLGGGWSQLSGMASGHAYVGKPAPNFQATAVVDGSFKEVKLSDYRGKGGLQRAQVGAGPGHWRSNSSPIPVPSTREIRGPLFLPAGLHLCVPHGDYRVQ